MMFSDIILGENIEKIRLLKGFTASQLAPLLSPPISYQQLRKYERGDCRITVNMMMQICEIVKCKPEEILRGSYDLQS